MRYKNLFALFLCFLTYTVCEKATQHNEKLEKGKKIVPDVSLQHHQSHKKADNQQQQDDEEYDTTQGYPILYPETHMMSLKRNISSQPNTTSSNVTEIDDELNDINDEQGKCNKSVDLLFLLDSSESVKYSNWKIIIEFVKDLCNRFQLHSTRVGIIRYASEAEVALPLTEFNTTEARSKAIDNIFYKTGGTRTDIALKKAAEVLYIEEQRSQVLMLVTDGPTNRLEIDKNHFVEGKDLVAGPAERLKEAGVALFCIGVEPDSETPEEIDTMKEEMNLIASEPTKMHLFISDGYRELGRKVQLISNAACVVNGGWSTWSEYSPCSVTCGYGTKVRMRTCTNPSPENNGAECTGPRVEIEECDLGPCTVFPIDGKAPVVRIRTDTVTSSQNKDALLTGHIGQATNNQSQSSDKSVNHGNQDSRSDTANKVEQNITNEHGLDGKHERKLETDKGEKIVEHISVKSGCPENADEVKLNDSQYNSSSVYTHDTDDEYVKREYAPQNAKLNNQIKGGGWCAEHKFAVSGDKNQFLQLDLGKKMTIDAVGTQGSHLLENWVKKYNLRYSDDGISWEYYNKNPLVGNVDRTTVRRNQLTPPVEARYIQLNPIEWNEENGPEKHEICMRAAVFKCKEVTMATVKRGVIQPKSSVISVTETVYNKIPRGVVLKEREWSHLPDQKTIFTLYSDRMKRQVNLKYHKGHKRIFGKLRKTAQNMLKKISDKFSRKRL